jgi:hypothetical protein
MVAASIHVLAASEQGAPGLPDPATPSSQGGLMVAMDVIECKQIPKVKRRAMPTCFGEYWPGGDTRLDNSRYNE